MTETTPRPVSDLVMEVADDLRLLVRKEIELARIEFLDGLKAQLMGAGLVFFALLCFFPAFVFAVVALAHWLPFSAAASFATVAGGLGLFALVVTGAGISIMRRRRPRLDRSIASIKEDVRWVREQIKS